MSFNEFEKKNHAFCSNMDFPLRRIMHITLERKIQHSPELKLQKSKQKNPNRTPQK